jgi:hypothetical protein
MTRLDPDLERLGEALRASTAIHLAREHEAAQATRPDPRRVGGTGVLRRPRLLAGGTLGLAGIGAALVLVLGGTAATTPAFAITTSSDGSALVHLNYTTDQNLPQVDAKLASMGIHQQVGIRMAPGAATVSGSVVCTQGPGAKTPVRVLVGANGTETIAAGQSAGNTAEGSFHLVSCSTSSDTGSGNTGNS